MDEIRTYVNDLGPARIRVFGRGEAAKIGQNGRPVERPPEHSSTQKCVVQANIRTIRKAIKGDKRRCS